MKINPLTPLRMALLTFLTGISLAACASAQTVQTNSDNSSDRFLANIKIKNFGKMDDRFYRGGQPKEDDYKDIAALGIKTVIDLKNDPAPYEKREVEALGMRYVNIPMSDKTYPRQEQIEQFLKLVKDPATGKFFVHCEGGRHRTGVMGAVYRFNFYHWNYDQVYKEMKDYDFYTRFGHGELKRFVEDYWQHLQTSANLAASTPNSR